MDSGLKEILSEIQKMNNKLNTVEHKLERLDVLEYKLDRMNAKFDTLDIIVGDGEFT